MWLCLRCLTLASVEFLLLFMSPVGWGRGPDLNRFLKMVMCMSRMLTKKPIKRANVSTSCEDWGTVCEEWQLSEAINVISENGSCPKVSPSLSRSCLHPKGTPAAMWEMRRVLLSWPWPQLGVELVSAGRHLDAQVLSLHPAILAGAWRGRAGLRGWLHGRGRTRAMGVVHSRGL